MIIDMLAGLKLEAHRKRLDERPYVYLHKLGSHDGGVWLTPEEATALAHSLGQAVKYIKEVED